MLKHHLQTLTCTLHWFCEKSNEERHVENLNTLGDAGCRECFQHKDLHGKMLHSTPKDSDVSDIFDVGSVDLHGCFRHNWASRGASHHINLSLHNSPWNSRQQTVFFLIEHEFTGFV